MAKVIKSSDKKKKARPKQSKLILAGRQED